MCDSLYYLEHDLTDFMIIAQLPLLPGTRTGMTVCKNVSRSNLVLTT